MAALYRLVDLYGWSDLLGTHISHRVPDEPDLFLLNPYGFLWEEMTPSILLKVDYDGNVLTESNHKVNPAGVTIHSASLRARPDVTCAIHTHTQAGRWAARRARRSCGAIAPRGMPDAARDPTGACRYGGAPGRGDRTNRGAQSLREFARGLPRDRRQRMAGAAPQARPDRSQL